MFSNKGVGQCIVSVLSNPEYNCVTGTTEVTLTINNSALPPPPYTITSVPAGINTVVTTNTVFLTNVPVNGQAYNLNIATTGTCSGSAAGSFVNPTSPANIIFSSTMVSCFGGNDGAASAIFSGAVAPFTWSWSTGSSNPGISGLSAGVYTVSITDSKNCTATRPLTITESPEIASSLSTTLVPCFGSTITTAVTTTGGVAPFNYTVNGTPITSSPGNLATNISAGTHTIITKDSKGCVKTNTLLLNQAAQQIISSNVSPPNCPGDSTGSIAASATGPVAGYTYSWNPFGNVAASLLQNVPAGNYTLYLLDASNCITRSVITVPAVPEITPVSLVKKENCSAVDGAFTLNVSGGTAPYTYTTLPMNVSGNSINNLSTGSYTSIIKDAKGCIDSTITYVGNLSTVSLAIFTLNPVACYNVCDGSVFLSVQNAVQPVNYSLTGTPVTTNTLFTGLCAGLYLVKALDGIGCPAFDTIYFPSPPVFTYSASTPAKICIGKTAQITATASGGNGQHTYVWNPGNLNGSVINVQPQVTTVYSLNVYDVKGCTLPPYQVTVAVNDPINIQVSQANAGICPGTTAQITPTITGGDGNYTYLWLPGETKGAAIFVENITVPAYTLEVADACGSPKALKEIKIKLHPVIQPTYQLKDTAGCAPFCATFINTTPGSSAPIWNYGDKPFEQTGDTTSYCYEKAGIFNLRLTLTDSNNCKTAHTYKSAIHVLEKPDASFITDPGIIRLHEHDAVNLRNTRGSAGAYSWFIDDVAVGTGKSINYTFRDTGCYDIMLRAENQNRCKDSTKRTVCVFEAFNFYMPSAFSPNNDRLNDVFLPKGTGWLYTDYLFEVFDRWGHLVFSTTEVFQGWDGGLQANPLVPDVTSTKPDNIYVWRVRVTDNIQEVHELKGHVMLLR